MGARDERIALDAYRIARADSSVPIAPLVLARRLFGPHSVIQGPRSLDSPGMVVRIRGVETIVLREGLSPIVARFTLFHEIAHRIAGPNEDTANRVAAALAMPLPALRAAPDAPIRKLATLFAVSQTALALRQGEAFELPSFVRARSWHWTRGLWSVPDDEIPTLSGIRKTRLTDAERRYLLRLA